MTDPAIPDATLKQTIVRTLDEDVSMGLAAYARRAFDHGYSVADLRGLFESASTAVAFIADAEGRA